MNWIKDKETKRSILISLIASTIFLVFIQPIMQIVWGLLIKISFSTFDTIMNSMYKNAALGQRNWIDFLLLTFLVVIGLNFIVSVVFRLDEKVIDIKEKGESRSLPEEELKNKLVERKIKLERKIANLSKVLILFSKIKWLLLIASIICSIVIIFNSYADLQLNTSFNQRLNALGPYVKETEVKLLKSNWALMKTRQDYLKINVHMDSLAKSANITLPENLME